MWESENSLQKRWFSNFSYFALAKVWVDSNNFSSVRLIVAFVDFLQ